MTSPVDPPCHPHARVGRSGRTNGFDSKFEVKQKAIAKWESKKMF